MQARASDSSGVGDKGGVYLLTDTWKINPSRNEM